MGWMTINHMPESVFRNVHGINPISICTVYIYILGRWLRMMMKLRTSYIYILYIDMIGANSLDDNKPTNWLGI